MYKTASYFNKLYTQALAPFQLTYSQYLVLMVLWEKDGVITKEIGEKLGLGIGTLNPILSKLQQRGWIEKATSPNDKRATIISLTPNAVEQQAAIEQSICDEILRCSDLLKLEKDVHDNLRTLNNCFAKYYK